MPIKAIWKSCFTQIALIIRSGLTVFIEHVLKMTVARLDDVTFGNITYKLFLILCSKLAPRNCSCHDCRQQNVQVLESFATGILCSNVNRISVVRLTFPNSVKELERQSGMGTILACPVTDLNITHEFRAFRQRNLRFLHF